MKRSMKSLLGTALVAAALAAPAQAEIGRHTFKVSNGAAEDHPVSAGIKGMSECLAEKTDGKMKLRGFYNGELGDDAEATQSVRSGSIEMVVTGAAAIGGIEPAMSAFELPFLFNSDAEVDAVMTGPYYDHVAARMPAHDLVLLSIWENGFRNSTNNKHAITRAEDFAGLNFRVMQNPIFLDTFRRLGANPVPMAFGEVFTALETGAVDGQENPLPLIQASRFYEVQKYLTLTRHAYSPTPVLMSKKVWDGLDPEEQALVQTCATEGRVKQIERSRAAVDEALAELKEHGMEVTELTPEATAHLRDLVAPVYEAAIPTVGQENYDLLTAELKKVRGN